MASSLTGRVNLKNALQTILSSLSSGRISLISLSIPSALKILVYIVLFLNLKAAPFVWHYRIFYCVIKSQLAHLRARLPYVLSSKAKKQWATDRYLDSLCPIGQSPFEQVVRYQTWASFDECDWNLHLSNSSYPKTFDAARMKAGLYMSPRFLAAGGICPLSGVSTHFIREVPMFAKYQVRVCTGSWDNDKWAYVICRVVTLPKGKKRMGSKDRAQTVLNASVPLPSHTISYSESPQNGSAKTNGSTEADLLAVKAKLLPTVEPDGAIVHAIAVSRICYKIGRITVPPPVVFATNGWTKDSSSSQYSHRNPPPHMDKVRELTHGGHKKYREFLSGGWRKVPPEGRWWNDMLGGEVETKRAERLALLENLPLAMDGAREMSVNQL